jgi:hypothetical protein
MANIAIFDPTRPFETEELIALRGEQRRLLAGFPDWVFRYVLAAGAASVTVLPLHPARAEMFVREFIRERMEDHKAVLAEWLPGTASVGTSAAEIGQFLITWHEVMSADEDFRTRNTPFQPLTSKVTQEEAYARPPIDLQAAASALFPVMTELASKIHPASRS